MEMAINQNETGIAAMASELGRGIDDMRSMLGALACHKVKGECDTKPLYYYNLLRNYGCNCYPENFDKENEFTGEVQYNFGGNGQPVDALDQACLKAYHNFRCFKHDLVENNFKQYNMAFGPFEECHFGVPFEFHQGRNGGIICGPESNPGYRFNRSEHICKLYACSIERAFAEEVFEIVGNRPGDYGRLHPENYNKGIDGTCEKRNDPSTDRNMCCGQYPTRYPYDPNRKVCCMGQLQSIGTC